MSVPFNLHTVNQSNILEDSELNMNLSGVTQLGKYNYGGVEQDIETGDNYQGNSSYIKDMGWGSSYDYGSGDMFDVNQLNYAKDVETNVNDAGIFQAGKSNDGYVDQEIDTGDNSQYNDSDIYNDYWGSYGSDSDAFNVGQSNILVDSDVNVNSANVAQFGLYNDATVDQDIDTGSNHQSNDSGIHDFGGYSYDGGEVFNITQSNALFDTETNVNSANVKQLGVENDAYVDQDITTGSNSQSNASEVFDFG